MKNKGVIDIGNSRTKAGIFDEKGQLIAIEYFDNIQDAIQWFELHEIYKIMISDVKGIKNLTNSSIDIQTVNPNLRLPFKNLYETPETLGTDRIAVMSAASFLFPSEPSLVFDIGTCMTIDFLSPEGEYSGGNISPGINMRLKAMAHFTGKLPLSTIEKGAFTFGNNTHSALANGAICGLLHEIEGYILKTTDKYPNVNVILCGGDAHYFEKQLKYKIFANQNLVLLGLYHLLVFND